MSNVEFNKMDLASVPNAEQADSAYARWDSKEFIANAARSGALTSMPGIKFDQLMRADSDETAFFSRQLEEILATPYNVVYPNRKARTLLPVNSSVANYVDKVTFRQFDKVGKINRIHDEASDFPSVEVFGDEYSNPVFAYGGSYTYSFMDLQREAVGLSVPSMRNEALRYAFETNLDLVAAQGDDQSGSGFAGLINIPNMTNAGSATLSPVDWTSGSITQVQVVNFFNDMRNLIISTTFGEFAPDTVVMPIRMMNRLATTYSAYSANSPIFMGSVLENFKMLVPGIENIEFWDELKGVGGSGHDVVMMYQKDPRVLQLVIPMDYIQMPPQQKNMAFRVSAYMRIAGLQVHYPKAICYREAFNV